jgi:hypothetical protein
MLRPDEMRDAIVLKHSCGVSPRAPQCDEGRGSVVSPSCSSQPTADIFVRCDGTHHVRIDGTPCTQARDCVWDHGGDQACEESEC